MDALNEMNMPQRGVKGLLDLKNGGIFDWIVVISRIDDEKTAKVCGTDIALYLGFLRNSARFFGIVSLMNIALLIIYATGTPQPQDDFRQHS